MTLIILTFGIYTTIVVNALTDLENGNDWALTYTAAFLIETIFLVRFYLIF